MLKVTPIKPTGKPFLEHKLRTREGNSTIQGQLTVMLGSTGLLEPTTLLLPALYFTAEGTPHDKLTSPLNCCLTENLAYEVLESRNYACFIFVAPHGLKTETGMHPELSNVY